MSAPTYGRRKRLAGSASAFGNPRLDRGRQYGETCLPPGVVSSLSVRPQKAPANRCRALGTALYDGYLPDELQIGSTIGVDDLAGTGADHARIEGPITSATAVQCDGIVERVSETVPSVARRGGAERNYSTGRGESVSVQNGIVNPTKPVIW